MSERNVKIVRAAIEAANRGDWDAAFKHASPDFEWDNSRAIGADNRAVWTADEAREFFKGMTELWESAWIEIDETIQIGDYVVVPHTTHIRGRDGIEAQARTTWVFTIRGDEMERVCLYQDREEALKDLGVEG